METLWCGEVYVVTAKAEPVDEASRHAVVLSHCIEFVYHLAVEETEVGGVGDDGCLADAIDDFVVKL